MHKKHPTRSEEEIRKIKREDKIVDNYERIHEFVSNLPIHRLSDQEIATNIEEEFGVSVAQTIEALVKSDQECETTANGLAKHLCELI